MKPARVLILRVIPPIALLCLAFAALPVAAARAQTPGLLSAKLSDPKFDPFGGYSIIGRVPKGFDDFASFQLDLIDPPMRGQRLNVAGGVYTLDGSIFLRFDALNLSSDRLSFITEAKGGVNYTFVGRFLRRGALSRFSKKVAVLEGVLRKAVNGRRVAESNVRFSHFEPH